MESISTGGDAPDVLTKVSNSTAVFQRVGIAEHIKRKALGKRTNALPCCCRSRSNGNIIPAQHPTIATEVLLTVASAALRTVPRIGTGGHIATASNRREQDVSGPLLEALGFTGLKR
jgi:hypothetical protein